MKRIILLAWLLFLGSLAQAHDFVVTLDGQKVYFNIKSQKNRTAEVTYNGSIAQHAPSYFEGELTIPEKVKHNDIVYTVTGIGSKAFSGADKLTGIILPSGIQTIGDFAFEGCTSLSKIIFPGGIVKFGQGVFFRCDKIQDISFGSDWKELDLKMFRWSDSLTVVTIPAKIERIQNLKSLKHLESVSIDINNARFSAIDGVLYNKNHETLYGCPRAYRGKLRIAEGTRQITAGALIDCPNIEQIDLPESLEAVSFREFSRMPALKRIIFRNEQPVTTAQIGTEGFLVLQVLDPGIELIVPKKAKAAYQEALVQQAGLYTEPEGAVSYPVKAEMMPAKKNIIGVKDFAKYE